MIDAELSKLSKKVFEFKLYLNAGQKKKLDHWIHIQNWVWNRGLALIEWREWYDRWHMVVQSGILMDGIETCGLQWERNNDEWALTCPRVKWRRYNPQKDLDGMTETGDDQLPLFNPTTGEWVEKSKDGKSYLVAFPAHDLVKEHWKEDPLIDGWKTPYFDLVSVTGAKEHRKTIGDCPSAFLAGTLKELANAWAAYKGGLRERPRYKGRRNRVRSLIHPKSKKVGVKNDFINIPNLGYVKAKGLSLRWDGQPFCPMKIVKDGGQYYLQITYDVEKETEKPNARILGLDLGGSLIYSDDRGHTAKPCDVSRLEKRSEDLRRKASRQYRANITVSPNGKHIPNEGWMRRNLTKTYKQISRIESRISRRRKQYLHFLSDNVVSLGEVLVFEDISIHGMKHGSGQKLNEDGHFDKNRQGASSGRNKTLTNASPGAFRALVEQKAHERGRTILYVNAAGTSKACSYCDPGGVKWEDSQTERLTQRLLWCKDCGRLMHADINAARNIRERGIREGSTTSKRKKRSTRKKAKPSTA